MKKYYKNIFVIICCLAWAVLEIFFWNIGMADTFFVFSAEKGMTVQAVIEILTDNGTVTFLLMLIVLSIVNVLIYLGLSKTPHNIKAKLYKYRYLLVAVITIICIFFKISGSSVGYYSIFFPSMADSTDTIFRVFNPVRSDEFGVNTVLAIAQSENLNDFYPYFSNIVRAASTDMFIVYGQPVWHYGVLFRPFQWGYLMFGAEYGLSFFWCARFSVLLCVSYEFGLLLFEKNKKLSFLYAIFILFSPAVQWWFAINSFVEMLICGQLCVLLLKQYLLETKIKKKVLYCGLFFWSGGCYVLGFYPAWQISFGYIFLALMIWVVITNRKNVIWNWKQDGIIIGIIMFIWILAIGGLFWKSRDTIASVMNTVYPGQRVSADKLQISDFFEYVISVFLPLYNTNMQVNWTFFDFFPLGIIGAICFFVRERKKDVAVILFLALEILLLAVYTFSVPIAILKITLLSNVPAKRMVLALGYLNILLLFRVLAIKKRKIPAIPAICFALVYSAVSVYIMGSNLPESIVLTKSMMVISWGILFVGCVIICIITRKKIINFGIVFMCTVMVFAGGLVNPVQKGLSFLLDNQVVNEIRSIASENEGDWLVEGGGLPIINIPLLAGAPTINCTNVYPALERWRLLDADGEYEDIYNRYAHIQINLKSEANTSFYLYGADYVGIDLNIQDLKKIGATYILSMRGDLATLSTGNIQIEKMFEGDGWCIYNVDYS